MLKRETCETIYAGVNFTFAPAPALDSEHFVSFQAALGKHGLEFQNVGRQATEFAFVRTERNPLQIHLKALPGPPIAQILVFSDWMRGVDLFVDDAKSACQALFEVWPGQKQVVVRDATVRQLYDASGHHAFQYLWERRLGQQEGQLKLLGRSVAGGGLRLVMPPTPEDEEPSQAEVLIESFLQNPRKLYVQVTMAFPKPTPPQDALDPEGLINSALNFATREVFDFLQVETGGR